MHAANIGGCMTHALRRVDAAAPDQSTRRLPFVDGLRGVAAFVVLVGHLIFKSPGMTQPRAADASALDWLAWPFRFGSEMVLLFIMVSGFSLYYSEVSRRARGRAATTYRQFIARRAWRIGPVYYVAVAFGFAASLIVGHQQMTPGGVVAHLFFVQNLNSDWLYQVNGPLWSIAYEVQLYLLFPLAFYAMRRWNPLLIAVLIAAAVKAISLLHPGFPVFGLARWFIAGALLAELSARGFRLPIKVSLPIGLAALFVGMAQLSQLSSELPHDAVWLTAFVFLMLAMLEAPESSHNPMVWPVVRWVGLRSYSLYALHFPVLLLILWYVQHVGLHGWAAVALMCGVGIPGALLVTAIGYHFIEDPSVKRVARVGQLRPVGVRDQP